MSKTLVEQLREMVEKSREDGGFPTDFAEPFIGCRVERSEEERELFTAIADRIEREYLPRPRFEDEEPVQFSDEFYSDEHGKTYKATMFVIYADGSYRVNQEGCNACQYEPDERMKRPEQEVLDADGVPIHVGDTVYGKDGRTYTVTRVIDRCMTPLSDEYRKAIDIECVVHENGKCGSAYNANPKEYTHKQPDSLERIEEDARKMFNDYWGCGDAECHCCPVVIDEKTPYKRYCIDGCAAAQRLDLLRRQREVLERRQE